jgi:hypothetical protein
MSTVLRRLSRQRHSGLALRAFYDTLHFGRTGILKIAEIEEKLLSSAGAIPRPDAVAAIRRGIAAAQRQTGRLPFNDELSM